MKAAQANDSNDIDVFRLLSGAKTLKVTSARRLGYIDP